MSKAIHTTGNIQVKRLRSGKKVLFNGLPCQVAVALYSAGDKYVMNLYTIDQICHGLPSPEVLQLYLQWKDIKFARLIRMHFSGKLVYGLV